MRSLEEWLAYQSQLHPRAIDLGLERLRAVMQRLRWRQPQIPVITVGGTNGKGSVCALVSSILSAAGYRVGTFTSPHLRAYEERIRIHDRYVSTAELLTVFEQIEAARGEVGLTFFEFNTLAALLSFEAAQLDVWVLEVGLGGRLDAVNVVDADVAAVVSIGLDHQEYLGHSLGAIAVEKAGIFRAGRAAVLGSGTPVKLEDEARRIGARLKRPTIEYNFIQEGAGWRYRGNRWTLPLLPAPALPGAVQFANAATALAALEELDDKLTLPPEAVARGLSTARLDARFQTLQPAGGQCIWILDVAHNEDAAKVLARNLNAVGCSGETLAVCGILADKDTAAIVTPLKYVMDRWWCASLEGTRGQSGAALAVAVRAAVTAPVTAEESVAAACAAALAAAGSTDRIVVFGSFHTVGAACDWLESQGLKALA